MAANKLDSSMLEDATVTDAKLANGAVTNIKLAAGIDATKLADGTVTSAELQYINSLSSNAQTQIDGAGGVTTATGSATFLINSTGAQSVTGLGFQPSTVFFNTSSGPSFINRWSVGFSVGNDDRSINAYSANHKTYAAGGQLYVGFESVSSSAFWEGNLTSMDVDGFTWTKTNAYNPAGDTMYVYWLAFK